MKAHPLKFLATVALLALSACDDKDSFSPRIDAPFNQRLTLRYQQSAILPNQAAPELTITVDDILEARCPEGMNCFQPGEVTTSLTLQDRAGAGQPVSLELPGVSTGQDSVAILANGRSYTIVLESVTPYPNMSGEVKKEDKRVVVIVRKR